jgi:hypothetical protein
VAPDVWLHGLYVRTLDAGADLADPDVGLYPTGAPQGVYWWPSSEASRLWLTAVTLHGANFWNLYTYQATFAAGASGGL